MSGGPYWPKKTIRGTTYDLSHLHPFVLDVAGGDPAAPILKVLVSFDLHTFTRKRFNADTPDLFLGRNGDPRSFCIQRFGCSQYLPDMIRRAATGNILKSHEPKFLCAETIPVVSGQYAAIFLIERAKIPDVHARMFVISAHERTNALAQMEAISFYTVIRKVTAGEPIPWPKKK